jgi:hypothetical protein
MGIIEVVGVLAMQEKEVESKNVDRELPYPQPKFWFGSKVLNSCTWQDVETNSTESFWQEGIVTGINWNPEKFHWQYLVYWEENSEDNSLLGYDNDHLLISERDLQVVN